VELVTVAKAFVVWLIILLLAIMNGVLRESIFIPKWGKTPGLVLSGLLLSVLILTVTYLALPWLNVQSAHKLIGIGCGWLLLTLVFEFSFGLLRGMPLKEILEAYTFKDGNIWLMVLLVTVLAPWIAAWFRGW